ncbi:MAG: hypothetical protein HDT14_10595 [Oscillibacter sp.]|nr:hypothetical protein [Oscillibacter sp.]
MKRLLALTLAAALALSLVACGGSGGTGDNSTPGGGNGDTTSTDKPGNESNATAFSYSSFISAFNDNELKAKSTYIGGNYKISAFVRNVESDFCILEILGAVAQDYVFKVELPTDDLMELSKGQRVTVEGTIEAIEGRQILVTSASLVSDSFEIEATVLSLVYASTSSDKPYYCTAMVDSMDNSSNILCNIYLDGDSLATLEVQQRIAVSGNVYCLSTNPLEGGVHEYNGEKILFEVQNAKIEKNG